jgi:hypothetical protein
MLQFSEQSNSPARCMLIAIQKNAQIDCHTKATRNHGRRSVCVTLLLTTPAACRLMVTEHNAWPATKQCMLELLQSVAAAPASATADRQLLQQLLHFGLAAVPDASSLSGSEVLQILRTLPLPSFYEQGTLLEAAYHTGEKALLAK